MYDRSRIPTTAQLRSLESTWIKACGSNWGVVLMEAAGLNAAQIAMTLWRETGGGGIVVICGRGNNGGDGLVVARHLFSRGLPVVVHMVRSEKPASPESESGINRHILEECVGLPIHYFDEDSMDELENALAEEVLVIDALLGTGLDRDVSGPYADAIELINESGNPVLAIDLPSGINSDSGQIMEIAVEADVTVTFGYLKAGLLNYPGAQNAGIVTVVDIGLPDINTLPIALHDMAGELESPKWWLATHSHVQEWLPVRPADGHKGTFGRVLAIAGSSGMTGAAMLASRTVLRAGAGYIVLATPKSVVEHLPAEEIVYHSVADTASGALDLSAFNSLQPEIEHAEAILIGPGIGADDATIKLVERLLTVIDKPCIIDADGLNALSKLKSARFKSPENVVITPHPKELERLTGMPVKDIQADRFAAAANACKKFGCTVILKGAHTVVATPEDGIFVIPTGNSGMATPGAGDVLSGIVAAFLATGMRPSHAAVAAAYVHGAAGDLAADQLGEDGMVASDIMERVPPVLAEIRDGEYPARQIELEVLD